MNEHFCPCPGVNCPQHPKNHPDGCDPCIADNIKKFKMPACFFHAVHEDMSDADDYTIDGFVQYYHRHRKPEA